MKTFRIKIPTITCASCTESLETVFNNTIDKKVAPCYASVSNQTLTIQVEDDVQWSDLMAVMADTGHAVNVELSFEDNHRVITGDNEPVPHAPDSMKHYLLRAGIAGLVGLPQFIVCLIGMSIPLYGMIIMAAVTLPALIYSGYQIFRRAYYEFKMARSMNMDTLFALSSSVSYIASVIGVAVPSLGIPMFFEAALFIILFRNVGIAVESKVKEAVGKYRDFLDHTPPDLLVNIQDAEPKWCVDVEVGDVFIVEAGEIVPLNGDVLEGQATVTETKWSGEANPREVGYDQRVYAGMTVETGRLVVRTSENRENSLLAKLDEQMREAESKRPRLEAFTTKVVKKFVPSVLLIAALSFVFVSAFVSPITALMTFASVLSVACPCVLGGMVGMSTHVGIRKAADYGAIFTKHQAMQTASEMDTLIFDKTGTLTQPDITEIVGANPEKILALACALEEGSTHVIADAVRRYGARYPNANAYYADNLEDYLGLGRRAVISGKSTFIGNERLLSQLHIDFSVYKAELSRLHAQGKSALFIVRDQKIMGYLVQEHRLKPDVKQSLNQLRQRGIKRIIMCTGSDTPSAIAVAKQIGIAPQDVYAEQTPEQKAQLVRQMQIDSRGKRRVVGYVGDGGNDAPAMKAADVSYVMNSGDEVCKNKADVILRDHSLQPFVNSVTISQQAMRNIKINLALTIGFNVVMIAIAAGAFIPLGFTLTPAVAAAFMIGEALVVLLSVFIFKKMKVPGADSVPKPNPTNDLQDYEYDYENSDENDLEPTLSKQPKITRSLFACHRTADEDNSETDISIQEMAGLII